jgi:hypothetical protein
VLDWAWYRQFQTRVVLPPNYELGIVLCPGADNRFDYNRLYHCNPTLLFLSCVNGEQLGLEEL